MSTVGWSGSLRTLTVGCLLFLAVAGLHGQDGAPVESLSLGTSFLYTRGHLDVYGKKQDITNLGIMATIAYGRSFTRVPGLELGCSASFLEVGNDQPFPAQVPFDVDIDPTPQGVVEVACKMDTSVVLALLLAKWAYTREVAWLVLGVETGFGVGYLYERNDWSVKNPLDPELDLAGDLERRNTVKPMVQYALRLGFRLGAHNQVGLVAGAIGMPVIMWIDDINYGVVPNLYYDLGIYQIYHIWHIGLFWRALS